MPSQPILVVLDEFTLWRVLRLCFGRRPVYLYSVRAVFAPLHAPLMALARLLLGRGLLRPAASIVPGGEYYVRRAGAFAVHGWLAQVEAEFFRRSGLSAGRPDPQDVAFPASKQTVNYISGFLEVLFFIYQCRQENRLDPLVVIGDPAARPLIDTLFTGERAITVETVKGWPGCNLLLAAIVLLRTAAHVLARLRLRPAPPRRLDLGVDASDLEERTMGPIRSILGEETGQRVLVVFRSAQARRDLSALYGDLPMAACSDGVYAPAEAVAALVRAARDIAAVFARFGHCYPSHFLQIGKVAYQRAMWRGFFGLYRLERFWAQDEYNVDHVMRTEALRRYGGRSLARLNGVPVFKVDFVFRYCDFDTAYVISEGALRRYNGDTWRRPQAITGVGTMGLSRADRERVADPRPHDVLVFAKPYSDGRALLDIAAAVARAFPDRTVTISAKRSSKRFGGYEEYEEFVRTGPPNLVLSDEPSFQLILKHAYCLCSESSILVEAVELNTPTMFLDIYGPDYVLIFRDYPQICLTTGKQAVAWLQGLEDGSRVYPWDSLADLVKLGGPSPYDWIRADWGLPPLPVARRDSEGVA